MEEQKRAIPLRKVRDVGETISATFEFIRLNFKNLFKAILYFAGPWYLVAIALMAIGASTDAGYFTDRFNIYSSFSSVFSGIATLVATLAVYSYLRLYLDNDQDSSRISISGIKDLILKFVGPYILTGLVLVIIVGIGFVLLVLPGIYAIVALSLTFIIIVMERKDIFEAISRSHKLMKGYWWGTFGLLILLGILQGIIIFAVMIPVGFALGLEKIFTLDPMAIYNISTTNLVISNLIEYFVSLIAQMLPIVGIALRYFSIVEEKEGTGMEQEIEQMGSTETE